jgi:hypothetical protein
MAVEKAACFNPAYPNESAHRKALSLEGAPRRFPFPGDKRQQQKQQKQLENWQKQGSPAKNSLAAEKTWQKFKDRHRILGLDIFRI